MLFCFVVCLGFFTSSLPVLSLSPGWVADGCWESQVGPDQIWLHLLSAPGRQHVISCSWARLYGAGWLVLGHNKQLWGVLFSSN